MTASGTKPAWDTLAIVGAGLLGASAGLAAKQAGIVREVVGIGRRRESLETALARGAVDRIATDLELGIAGADLVLICTPVAQIVEFAQRALAAAPQALVSDVGSTKVEIVAALADHAAGQRFVGGHPLAGDSKTGPEHARADLFRNRVVVLTPTAQNREADVAALAAFWESLGARVVRMDAASHDRAVAFTSHLPHLLASAIAGSTPEGYFPLVATGWLDTTRIAAGDPALWRQIMLANRENLLAALAGWRVELAAWQAALDAGDGAALETLLTTAKRNRDALGS